MGQKVLKQEVNKLPEQEGQEPQFEIKTVVEHSVVVKKSDLESQLQQGELANNRKTINPSTEVSYLNYSQTPLIPSLKSTVTNPANLVESVAAEGWIRGGIPVRQLTRDQEYVQN